ncbi:MAG: Rpn family recombination-promoting nuclease/putative transposase [Desulfococcaceae bacterium]
MADPGNLHDHFFREIAKDPVAASGLLENFLPPDVRAMVDMDSIELRKDSFVEPDLRAYYSDLLFRVRLAEAIGYVYFLVEHKSHPDRFVHLQALNYIKPIWGMRKGKALPLVIPVVVYHGQRNWPYDPRFSGVFPPNPPALSRFFPDFEVVLADLGQYSDEDIRGAVLTRAFLLVLKHARSSDFPDRMPGIFRLLGELSRSRTGLGHLEAMLRYLARVAEDITPESVETLVDEHFPEKEGGRVMATLAEQWEERGLQKGIRIGKQEGIREGKQEGIREGKQEGIREGKQEGIREAIRDGLEAKFGDAGTALMTEIRDIDEPERLRSLLKRMWTASSLEEFRERLREG